MKSPEEVRELLNGYTQEALDNWTCDQSNGIAPPPVEKPWPADAVFVDLVDPDSFQVGKAPLIDVIRNRRSRRVFTHESLTLEELSYLLWATQGVRSVHKTRDQIPYATMRTAPSAGARHAFETYLVVTRVDDLEPGLYRYLATEHKLMLLNQDKALPDQLTAACLGQKFAGTAAVTFIWSATPYRMEWRYSIHAAKFVALDAGHVCQNLYLASESIGAGTCGIGAYKQEDMDALIGVDGKDERTIYLSPVGKIK